MVLPDESVKIIDFGRSLLFQKYPPPADIGEFTEIISFYRERNPDGNLVKLNIRKNETLHGLDEEDMEYIEDLKEIENKYSSCEEMLIKSANENLELQRKMDTLKNQINDLKRNLDEEKKSNLLLQNDIEAITKSFENERNLRHNCDKAFVHYRDEAHRLRNIISKISVHI